MMRSKASFVMATCGQTNTTENITFPQLNCQMIISKPRAYDTGIVFMNNMFVVCKI